MTRIPSRWVLFLFAAISGICVGVFVYSRSLPDAGADLFARRSYFVILALFLLWVSSLARLLRSESIDLRGWALRNWKGIAGAASITLICAFSVPMEFKTLSDETNLLSVSQSMLNDRTSFNTTLAKNYYGSLNPAFVSIPTRPLMHPFFVHLLHQFTGYRYENAFYLNLIVYFTLLVFVYGIGKRMGGPVLGTAAQILVASYPIFSISATSGGFDLISVLFFVAFYAALWKFIEKNTAERWIYLLFTALVFANIRYESVLFLPIMVAVIALCRKWTHDLTERVGWSILTVPVFLLPFFIQRALTPNSFENPAGVEPFSIEHWWNHLGVLLVSQVDFLGVMLPYAALVNWFIPVALIAFLWKWRQGLLESWSREQKVWTFALVTGFALSTSIFLAHHMGIYTHPTQARFFLLFSLAGALSLVALARWMPERFTPGKVLVFACAAFLIYHPIAVQNRFINILTLNRETRHQMEFLERQPSKNILVVSDRPGQYSSLGYGAVDFPHLARNLGGFMNEFRRRLFQEIFVFQKVDTGTGKPFEMHVLDENQVKLETLYEAQIDSTIILRVSRVLR